MDINKPTLVFMWRGKRFRISNTTSKEKNTVRGMTLPDFEAYYETTVIKTVRYLGVGWGETNRSVEENRESRNTITSTDLVLFFFWSFCLF